MFEIADLLIDKTKFSYWKMRYRNVWSLFCDCTIQVVEHHEK